MARKVFEEKLTTGIVSSNTTKIVYDFNYEGYIMGLEVLDTREEQVSVTLFHWESEGHKKIGFHYVGNEEQYSLLKVYCNTKGRYIAYKKKRIYL